MFGGNDDDEADRGSIPLLNMAGLPPREPPQPPRTLGMPFHAEFTVAAQKARLK